jgi:hypothetical protein
MQFSLYLGTTAALHCTYLKIRKAVQHFSQLLKAYLPIHSKVSHYLSSLLLCTYMWNITTLCFSKCPSFLMLLC